MMPPVQLRFLGSGDAFGSGGRMHTCFHITSTNGQFLIDCGCSALIAMRRFGVDPNAIDAILVSHLHGDHFGGIPFLILDGQLVSKRTRPLAIAGPAGVKRAISDAMEVMFPGSSRIQQRFPIEVVELVPERPHVLEAAVAVAYEVEHPAGEMRLAFRVQCDGKVIAYSGDTGWAPSLVSAARGSDLFIVEAYFFDKKVRDHLDFETLRAHLGDVSPRRWIVTHMSSDMLTRVAGLGCEYAEDGKVVTL
jgi:ribonuclease BN (tRNA processing enzyme)